MEKTKQKKIGQSTDHSPLLALVVRSIYCIIAYIHSTANNQIPGIAPTTLMDFSRLFLVYLLVVAVPVLAATDAPMARSPDCATRCGHIDVPFPFGLEAHCAIHIGFHLHCTKTVDGTSKLLLNNTFEVIKISVQQNKVWVKTRISRQCYDQSTKAMIVSNEEQMNITGTPYVLSRSDNKMIGLGCTQFAYIRSHNVSNLNIPQHSE